MLNLLGTAVYICAREGFPLFWETLSVGTGSLVSGIQLDFLFLPFTQSGNLFPLRLRLFGSWSTFIICC